MQIFSHFFHHNKLMLQCVCVCVVKLRLLLAKREREKNLENQRITNIQSKTIKQNHTIVTRQEIFLFFSYHSNQYYAKQVIWPEKHKKMKIDNNYSNFFSFTHAHISLTQPMIMMTNEKQQHSLVNFFLLFFFLFLIPHHFKFDIVKWQVQQKHTNTYKKKKMDMNEKKIVRKSKKKRQTKLRIIIWVKE